MNIWNNETLVINYPDLGTTSSERVLLIGALSVLFNKKCGEYTLKHLLLGLEQWNLLYRWLEQGKCRPFWSTTNQAICISQICETHILIGTGLLLADLQSLIKNHLTQPDMDSLWLAARAYVARSMEGDIYG